MNPGQMETDSENALRLVWAVDQKITGKTVELLIKEGFSSMEALVDSEDLSYTKIPRGQQKLLLKAILPLQPQVLAGSAAENNMAATATGVDGPAKAEQQVVMDREEVYTTMLSQWASDNVQTHGVG